jgi:sensor histidine kinase regulating citrate/malate metabolism
MALAISFKSRIISSYIFIVVVSFALVAFFLDKNLEKNSLQEIQSSLLAQAELIANQIPAKDLKDGDTVYLERLARVLKPKVHSRMTVIDTQGKVLADSENHSRPA